MSIAQVIHIIYETDIGKW